MADFDSDKPIAVTLPSGCSVSVRFPTDEQWRARCSQQRLVKIDLGRGKEYSTVTTNDDANAELVATLLVDQGVTVTPKEASYVLRTLETTGDARAKALPGEPEVWQITMRPCDGQFETVHYLRTPTLQEILASEDAKRTMTSKQKRGSQTIIGFSDLTYIADFYDRLVVLTRGYVGAIPIVHKAIAEILATQVIQLEECEIV
jgi:hypothetical protein